MNISKRSLCWMAVLAVVAFAANAFALERLANGYYHTGEGIRQKKIDRTCQAIHPEGATRFADRNSHLLSRRDKALHASGPRRLIRNEISVRILRQPIGAPLHSKYRFDA